VREEVARKFQEATILAFYGSAIGLEQDDTERISQLVDRPRLSAPTSGC
jgi:hypothetical protein